MKVAIVLLALAALAAADYGKQTVDWSHVPYYNVEWESLGEGKGYGGDSYGDVLRYRQKETRSKDNTQTNWDTELPGKSWIKRDDLVNAQVRVSHSVGGDYKTNDYKKY